MRANRILNLERSLIIISTLISKHLLSSCHVPVWTEQVVPSLLLFVAPWGREKIHKKMCLVNCQLNHKETRGQVKEYEKGPALYWAWEAAEWQHGSNWGERTKETLARVRESFSGAFETCLENCSFNRVSWDHWFFINDPIVINHINNALHKTLSQMILIFNCLC